MSPRCPQWWLLSLMSLLSPLSPLSLLSPLSPLSLSSGVPGAAGAGQAPLGAVTSGTPGDLRGHCPGLAPPGERGQRPGELEELEGSPVRVVTAGPELRDFGDIEEEPKVIGHFEGPGSEGFRSFSAAARRFHPSLLFFVTFDPRAAAVLGLAPGRVLLFQPFLERPRSFGGSPGDPPGLEAFLEGSKRATLRKLKAPSAARSWEDAWDGTRIVAFAQGDDPDGFEFLETLREVAQDRRDEPEFSILWIDPGEFPTLVPSWEDTFDIDLSRPQLGVINGTDRASSVWLDMEDEEDLPGPEEVLEWLEEVLEGDTGDSDGDDDDDEDDNEDDNDDEDGDEDGDEDEDDANDDDKVDDNDNDAD